MYAVFLCASCGFYIIFNFYLSGCSSRERGRSVLLLYSVSSRVRTFISVLPRTSAAAPSDPSLFSLTNIFSSISSHLISPQNFYYQSIICPVPQYHPTISVLLLTPRCKDTSSVVLHVFFVSLLLCRSTRGARLFEISGNNSFSLLAAFPHAFAPLCPHHTPHTFFRNFHTHKHIHTHTILTYSPHTPPA